MFTNVRFIVHEPLFLNTRFCASFRGNSRITVLIRVVHHDHDGEYANRFRGLCGGTTVRAAGVFVRKRNVRRIANIRAGSYTWWPPPKGRPVRVLPMRRTTRRGRSSWSRRPRTRWWAAFVSHSTRWCPSIRRFPASHSRSGLRVL